MINGVLEKGLAMRCASSFGSALWHIFSSSMSSMLHRPFLIDASRLIDRFKWYPKHTHIVCAQLYIFTTTYINYTESNVGRSWLFPNLSDRRPIRQRE